MIRTMLHVVMPAVLALPAVPLEIHAAPPPNIILVVADDQGYADLSCYGSTVIRTPNLDRLATDGVRCTDFNMTAAQCTPSRASLLTGCYAQRVNLEGVLLATATKGLSPAEVTLPELLREAGYATGLFGKWHLGHLEPFLPLHHGFDTFYGIPYSNDMEPFVIYRDREVVERDFDQATLTRKVSAAALSFVEQHRDRPFFACVWHPMPHKPVAASEAFLDSSGFGTYGDACREIDAEVGRLRGCLEEMGLAQRTLVIYTSDNGPWQPLERPDPEVGGSAFPLRGHKANEYQGGFQVPFIAWWPGVLPAGTVCNEMLTGLDLLPTLVALAGAEPPTDRRIDGTDIWPVLAEGAPSPYRARPFFYYHYNSLDAVREGPWKLMVPRTNREDYYFYYRERENEATARFGDPEAESIPLTLFNLDADPGEATNVLADHPAVADRLRGYLAEARRDLGDKRVGVEGEGRRPVGRVGSTAR